MNYQAMKISQIIVENSRTKSFVFERGIDAQPGQFIMAWLPGVEEKPFSISHCNPLKLTIVNVGPFSQMINSLSVGDRIWIRGPFGNGFGLTEGRILLVGGGYGVAPLHYLAEQAAAAGISGDVCIGARTKDDVLYATYFDDFHFPVHIATEDGSKGEKGLITATVKRLVAENSYQCLYACGPTGLLKALYQLCKEIRLPCQLSWEAHISCGLGLCGRCEVHDEIETILGKGWLACVDGPVLKESFDSTL